MVSAMQELLAGPDPATELHHRIPRRLLRAYDRACELAPPGEVWSEEGLQLWLGFELEASKYGINPNVTRDELAAAIEGSTVELLYLAHRFEAHTAGEWREWGRRGGLATLRRRGRAWFGLLARRRWGRIAPEELAAFFPDAEGGPR